MRCLKSISYGQTVKGGLTAKQADSIAGSHAQLADIRHVARIEIGGFVFMGQRVKDELPGT
ncbi:MAG: hypothetical protein ACRDBI_03145 [Shewanella sp.]